MVTCLAIVHKVNDQEQSLISDLEEQRQEH